MKHAVLLVLLVSILVAGMLYCISPGEVEVVASAARFQMATAASTVKEATAQAGEKMVARIIKPAKPVDPWPGPDPFWPDGRRPARGPLWSSTWFKTPLTWALGWLLVPAALLMRYIRKKRGRRAIEDRMAISLSKAVRRDGALDYEGEGAYDAQRNGGGGCVGRAFTGAVAGIR